MILRAFVSSWLHVLCVVLISGCSSRAQQLLPVPLPDLSRAAKPVQDQLRQRYASLTSKIEDGATPAAELANEYGETGKLLMAAEHRDAAEPCFLNAQALMPGDARWPYYLAHLYRLGNDPEKSAMFFEKALQLRPDDVAALVWLGGLYLLQGRPEAAEPLFTKALTRQPRLAAALSGLGRAALARRDYAGAVKYLEEALAQDQPASIIHYPLAMAYRGVGELDKADAHLRQRGHVEPAPPDPMLSELNGSLHSAVNYERLGVNALDTREWAAAAGYFRKGVELAPDNPSVSQWRSTLLRSIVRGVPWCFLLPLPRRSPEPAADPCPPGQTDASPGRKRPGGPTPDRVVVLRFYGGMVCLATLPELGLLTRQAMPRTSWMTTAVTMPQPR